MPATQIKSVDIQDGQVLLLTDGAIGNYRHFRLGAPPRLVVDFYDIRPGVSGKAYPLSGAFKGLRVGKYPSKTRFVFDAAGEKLPEYSVSSTGQAVQVVWDEKPVVGQEILPSQEGTPVTVEAIDFS
ncbi:MAG: AMIN domain-containing protein [Syntrophotaleaceae bacterium]